MACIPPPFWLIHSWDSGGGHAIIWLLTLFLVALAAFPWKRHPRAQFSWHLLTLGFAATGLIGLWIWTYAMIDAGGAMGL